MSVPKGTTATIVEDYGEGVMVEWDLPHEWKPLCDGFSKDYDLQFLDKI